MWYVLYKKKRESATLGWLASRVRRLRFEAEDGIRDIGVTGVQTCALFFSSRRRHTRYRRDWSSDVCSSDLATVTALVIVQAALCGATFTDRPAREVAFNALTNYYKCRDGRWLILTILNEEKQWPEFMKCLDREDLIDDPRFAKKADRLARSRELIALLDKEFEKH